MLAVQHPRHPVIEDSDNHDDNDSQEDPDDLGFTGSDDDEDEEESDPNSEAAPILTRGTDLFPRGTRQIIGLIVMRIPTSTREVVMLTPGSGTPLNTVSSMSYWQ